MVVGAVIGAVAGHSLDRAQQGQDGKVPTGPLAFALALVETAMEFFQFFIAVCQAVFGSAVERLD